MCALFVLFACEAAAAGPASFVPLRRAARKLGLQIEAEDFTQRYTLRGPGNHIVVCPGFRPARVHG